MPQSNLLYFKSFQYVFLDYCRDSARTQVTYLLSINKQKRFAYINNINYLDSFLHYLLVFWAHQDVQYHNSVWQNLHLPPLCSQIMNAPDAYTDVDQLINTDKKNVLWSFYSTV